MSLPRAGRYLKQAARQSSSSSGVCQVVAVANSTSTSVALSPEQPASSPSLMFEPGTGKQPMQLFLSSLVGCTQQALARAATQANVKLGPLQWRAESQLTQAPGPQKLAAVSLKADLLERVPQAQLEALTQRALQESPLAATLASSGCRLELQLEPAPWAFKSSMGDWISNELLRRAS